MAASVLSHANYCSALVQDRSVPVFEEQHRAELNFNGAHVCCFPLKSVLQVE